MTTNTDENVFVKDGVLYIKPTLQDATLMTTNNTINLTEQGICTGTTWQQCVTSTNTTNGTIVQPVKSGRLTTIKGASIQYGRIEVEAQLPAGDWLWPAIWLLPVNSTYGPWPESGEIDIMEARGNPRSYTAQGVDFVRGSLNWGPLTWLNENFRTFGWWQARRRTFNQDFHTYVLEWDDKFM